MSEPNKDAALTALRNAVAKLPEESGGSLDRGNISSSSPGLVAACCVEEVRRLEAMLLAVYYALDSEPTEAAEGVKQIISHAETQLGTIRTLLKECLPFVLDPQR